MTRVLNVARLERKLRRIPEKAREEIRTRMAAAADEIVAMMKNLAPVLKDPDPRRHPGALRDSIGWTWGSAPKGAMTLAQVGSVRGDLTITIYAGSRDKTQGLLDAFYARWVEFGTSKMEAQPYFYVSWRANKKQAGRQMRAGLRRAARMAGQNA